MAGLFGTMFGSPIPGVSNPYTPQGMPQEQFPVPLTPETIQLLRQQFGVQAPQPRQNMIMPEPGTGGFFGQHPNLARGLESGMLGAAMTPTAEGPQGAGGGIARTLQGVFGVPQARRQFQVQQIMAPFQQAEATGGLKSALGQLEAQKALTNYYNSFAGYRQQEGDIQRYKAQLAAESKQQVEQMKDTFGLEKQELVNQISELKLNPSQWLMQAAQKGPADFQRALKIVDAITNVTKTQPGIDIAQARAQAQLQIHFDDLKEKLQNALTILREKANLASNIPSFKNREDLSKMTLLRPMLSPDGQMLLDQMTQQAQGAQGAGEGTPAWVDEYLPKSPKGGNYPPKKQ